MEKSSFKMPRSVQETIPIKRIWEDGIFQLSEQYGGLKQYSVTYRVSDINYSISSPEEKEYKFLQWEQVLNSFDTDARYKISIFKRKINTKSLLNTVALPMKDDDYDEYREAFNEVVIKKALQANGITQEIYLTVTAWKADISAAISFFNRQFTQISQSFSNLGARLAQVDAVERLRIFHDFYRQGEEVNYNLDLKDMMKQGNDIRDYICPDVYDTNNHSADHFKIGDTWGRALELRNYATFIKDDIVSKLCAISRPCCFSIDLVSIPTDESIKAAQAIKMRVEGNKVKYLQKAAQKGLYGATITYDMQQQLDEADEYLNDLTERDQRMFVANISMVHLASTKEELDEDTEEIFSAARTKMCQMAKLFFNQLKGLVTALPYGVNWLYNERTLTTEGVGVFLPFRAQEVTDKGGLYFGNNVITGNLITVDLSKLSNLNRFVIGIPGGGKSFGVKLNILQLFLNTKDYIIILDPENEYSELVELLGGQVIRLSARSETHINPFDMVTGYAENERASYYEKSNFIVSLFELIDKRDKIGADDKSIIDRCVTNIYRNATGGTPTLKDLRAELNNQPEDRAKVLALKLELFTEGSLNVFSNQTNISFDKRIISFDTSDLEGDLKTIGNLIVTDCLVNRVTENCSQGRFTDLFLDEFQTMLREQYSAQYFNSAWRRYRKRSASPCGITQNIEYLRSDVEFNTMFGNSPCVTLYQLTPDDVAIVADTYNLSEKQLEFVSANAQPGTGLVKVGANMVPFDSRIPKTNILYSLLTTSAGEWKVKKN
ncbi:MAG: ATP-binding protein [Eubacterium sp.]|nr:ATP-binding protein [Eubacterium sp.]